MQFRIVFAFLVGGKVVDWAGLLDSNVLQQPLVSLLNLMMFGAPHMDLLIS